MAIHIFLQMWQKITKMPQNGKKSQKIAKNAKKCQKCSKKHIFMKMCQNRPKKPKKGHFFMKICKSDEFCFYTPNMPKNPYSARPTESSTEGKSHRMDAPSEAREVALICGVFDAKARAQDRGGGGCNLRQK